MKEVNRVNLLAELLAPRTLLLGAGLSFLCCCLLGKYLSGRNHHDDFQRFHPQINYLSLYHPTASETLAIAKPWMDQDKIIVVIGGDSVMFGSGQGARHAWSQQLQAMLGDRYRVLNFAMHGTAPLEVGGIAAELIAQQHRKVLFLTHIWPGANGTFGDPDGATQAYFYWDAYYKGMLSSYPTRDMYMMERDEKRKLDAKYPELQTKYAELQTRTKLDSYLYNQDLWTSFTHRYLSTTWCPLVAGSFTKPRKNYSDADPCVPKASRYSGDSEKWLAAARQALVRHRPGSHLDSPVTNSLVLDFPPHMRERTLVLVTHLSPHYIDKLTGAEQSTYRDLFPQTIRSIEVAQCHALEVGNKYSSIDFYDLFHLSAEGAVRMAHDVAPQVQELAKSLGYLK